MSAETRVKMPRKEFAALHEAQLIVYIYMAQLAVLAVVRVLPAASTHDLQAVQPEQRAEQRHPLRLRKPAAQRPRVNPFQIFPAIQHSAVGTEDQGNTQSNDGILAHAAVNATASGASSTCTCGVVISAFRTNLAEMHQLRELMPAWCSTMVYDKGPEAARCHASRIPPEMHCAAIDNKGNDWNPTWLKHVHAHYDALPDLLIAVPSNSVTKHERFQHLVSACANAKFGAAGGGADDFCCVRSLNLPQSMIDGRAGYAKLDPTGCWHQDLEPSSATASLLTYAQRLSNCTMVHKGRKSAHRPLRRWLEHHVSLSFGDPLDLGDPCGSDGAPPCGGGRALTSHNTVAAVQHELRVTQPCRFSLFATSAANLRARPRSFYEHLLQLFESDERGVSEDAYFMEFSGEAIWGAAGVDRRQSLRTSSSPPGSRPRRPPSVT